jgi:hypothetical protein
MNGHLFECSVRIQPPNASVRARQSLALGAKDDDEMKD